MSAMTDLQTVPTDIKPTIDTTATLMRELVAHLRENRTGLREEWLRRIFETELLTAMTREEVFAEATSVYDSYVEALETRTLEALQSYAQNLSERIIPRGVETHEVVGIVMLLRDVLARSLFGKYHANFKMLYAVLDAYEPAANSIAITVADTLAFADAWNVEILATDIGRQALDIAERATYSGRTIASVNERRLATHFAPAGNAYQVRPRIRKMVNFVQMNLSNPVYVGRMDLIFCMNVLIYFSEERKRELVQRFYDALEPGGYLFLGHSESISKMPVKFQAIVLNDCILYRKPTAEELLKPELVAEGRA